MDGEEEVAFEDVLLRADGPTESVRHKKSWSVDDFLVSDVPTAAKQALQAHLDAKNSSRPSASRH
jgi:hypothetical protein